MALELYHVSIPLKHTFWPTWIPGCPQSHNNVTLIKIITDEGIEGYSAGTAMGSEREGLGDLIGGYLIGADPTDIDGIQGLPTQAGFLGWRNFWIEPACWDIIGKSQGKQAFPGISAGSALVGAGSEGGDHRAHHPRCRRHAAALHASGARFRDRRGAVEDIRQAIFQDHRVGSHLQGGVAEGAQNGPEDKKEKRKDVGLPLQV